MADDTIVAFFRLIFFSSQKKVIEISLMETVEVRDARKRSRKNSDDHTAPPGSWLKMNGSTSNTKVGPASGDIPKEKTAGKMITPASIATTESRMAVVAAVLASRLLLLK